MSSSTTLTPLEHDSAPPHRTPATAQISRFATLRGDAVKGPLTAAGCAALFGDKDAFFRGGEGMKCEEASTPIKRSDVFNTEGKAGAEVDATKCDINWREGHGEEVKTSNGPAILGLAGDINEACKPKAANLAAKPTADPTSSSTSDTNVCDGFTRLYMNPPSRWTMCTNMKWLMCSAAGFMNGQGGKKIMFATAPKDMTLGWGLAEGATVTAEQSAVTVHEVCLLNSVCSNGADLWTLKKAEGESTVQFECDFNAGGEKADGVVP